MATGSQNMTTYLAKGLEKVLTTNAANTDNLLYVNTTDTNITADILGSSNSIAITRMDTTGAYTTGHMVWLNAADIGTPFQLVVHDSSDLYLYKRWKSSGTWTDWVKMNAGHADDATVLTSNAGGTEQPIYFTGGKPAATSYALKATVNNGTAAYLAYYSGARAISSWSYAKFHDGCLSLFPTTSSYREGMRIHSAGSWSDITLCGNDNTGDSGTSANSWFLGNNNGNFYISRNGSPGSTAYLSCVSNAWKILGNTTHDGIVYFANGTTYYINNSADSYLRDVKVRTLGIAQTDGAAGYGVSLYNGPTTSAPTYGIMFAKTGTFGTHGAVTSDWATYFTMSDTTARGWIFRRGTTNVASISGGGTCTLDGGLEIKGHIAGDGGTTGHGLYSGGAYHNAYNNIILQGDSTSGSSGIAFVSSKGTATINQPSDRAFIQFHAYGVTTYTAENTAPTLATSGEANVLVIGVGNDATDTIRLQTPGRTGLLHQVAANAYVIPDTNNTTGSVGGTTTPVYIDGGVIKACTAYASASVNYATSSGSCTGNAATATKLKDSAHSWTATEVYNYMTARVLKAGDTMTGSLVISQPSDHRNYGIIGTYDSTKAAAIWSMGNSYQIKADGTTLGNLYGAAYAHTNATGALGSQAFAGGHQFLWCQGGTIYVALGNNLWVKNTVTAGGFSGPLTGNVTGNCSGSSGSCTGNAATASKVGEAASWLYFNHSNEVNFGGTNTNATIFLGYRATDSRPKPTTFVFGSGDGTATVKASSFVGALTGNVTGNCSGSSGSCTGNAATATSATSLNTHFTYKRVIAFPAASNPAAGWRRVCKVTASANYAYFMIGVNGGWNNGAPSNAIIACTTRHTGATLTLIACGFKGLITSVRLVNVSNNIFWVDAYMSAQSNGVADQTLEFWGNVSISEEQNSGAVFSTSVTAAASVDLTHVTGISLTSDNYTSYTVTKTGSGASGSWDISVTGSSASCTGNAATATKLKTARSINGTNFDGSGNITTANWGTARNITIKDSTSAHAGTAVSVNGSGAVTLLLPATITAALVGNVTGHITNTGALRINANTDNSSADEPVYITSGHGTSSAAADGLAVGKTTLKWKGNSVAYHLKTGRVTAKTKDIWIPADADGNGRGAIVVCQGWVGEPGGSMYLVSNIPGKRTCIQVATGGYAAPTVAWISDTTIRVTFYDTNGGYCSVLPMIHEAL